MIDNIQGIGTPLQVTLFDITPCPAPRSTKNTKSMPYWSDEYCMKKDAEYLKKTGKKGTLLYAKNRELRYKNYKFELKKMAENSNFVMPEDAFAIWFLFPVTKSWTKKKKKEMEWQLHKIQLDLDNLTKGFFDSIMPKALRFLGQKGGNDDRKISSFCAFKLWCPENMSARIYIAEYPKEQFKQAFFKDIEPLIKQ